MATRLAWREQAKWLAILIGAIVLPAVASRSGSKHASELSVLAVLAIATTVGYLTLYHRKADAIGRSVLIGIAIEIILIALYQAHWMGIHKVSDLGADLFVGLYRWSSDDRESIPIVFVEIDDLSVPNERSDTDDQIDGSNKSDDSWEDGGRVSAAN